MCDFKDLRRLRSIGPQPRAGSGLQDRPPSACPILVGWVPTATAAKFFRASYWNSSLKQALRRARKDHVTRLNFEVARQEGDLFGYGPDHIREVPRLFRRPIHAQRNFATREMPDLRGGVDWADGAGEVSRLAQLPRATEVFSFVLKVAPGHVEADGVAIDMVERRLDRNVAPALAERNHHLNLEVIIRGFRRVGEFSSLADGHGQKRIGRLHEEEGRFSVRIMAHLACMGGEVTSDAIDPPHRKLVVRADDGQGRAGRLLDNVEHGRNSNERAFT